jgi:hypothetical protein
MQYRSVTKWNCHFFFEQIANHLPSFIKVVSLFEFVSCVAFKLHVLVRYSEQLCNYSING